MMRKRLRPYPTPEELGRLYAAPHDHHRWADHLYRVDVTSAMAALMLPGPRSRVADLSCGDAVIAKRLRDSHGAEITLGDYAPGYQLTGPIEQTIAQIGRADLFICSETVEHLDDPDMVLRQIRQKTDRLILSTPDGERDDANPEHVWGWDAEMMAAMLNSAGFVPFIHATVDLRPAGGVYAYQIWGCQ